MSEAARDRLAEIERLARLMCRYSFVGIDPDTIVLWEGSGNVLFQRGPKGCIVPHEGQQRPAWHLYYSEASIVVDDAIKRKEDNS